MKRSILLALVAVACVIAVPAFAGDDAVCAECHDEVAAGMKNQIHMRIHSFEVYGRDVGCVGCHGDGEAHMEEGDTSLINTFAEGEDTLALACQVLHPRQWRR